MNKAFVREAEGPEDLKCPGCGAIGVRVGAETLAAHVSAEARRALGAEAFYCEKSGCGVAYFDEAGQTVTVTEAGALTWPKNPAGLLCPCFGVTVESIEAAAERKDPTAVRELIAQAKSRVPRCVTASPSGASCVGEAQRIYLRAMAKR